MKNIIVICTMLVVFVTEQHVFAQTDNRIQKEDPGGPGEIDSQCHDDATTVCIGYGLTYCPSVSAYKLAVNGYLKATGFRTEASGSYPIVIGGDSANSSTSSNNGSTIAGGRGITLGGGSSYSTVGGGYAHEISGTYNVVSGGSNNDITPSGIYYPDFSVIAGGQNNVVYGDCDHSFLGGGYYNEVKNDGTDYAVLVGGRYNDVTDDHGVVVGGYVNAADYYGFVGGGYSNDASGDFAVVPGGYNNTASASTSFAAGYNATASHVGSFVWNDQDGSCSSTQQDEFRVCADNGAYFESGIWADSYNYNSPYPESVEVAYDAVFSLKRLPDGQYDPNDTHNQLDHSDMHVFLRRETSTGHVGGSLDATVMAQNEVIKDLVSRIHELEAHVVRLEELLGAR